MGRHPYPWGSPEIIGLFAASVVLIVAWWLAERRAASRYCRSTCPQPGVPRERRDRPLAAGFAYLFLPLFLQVVHGVSPTLSGVPADDGGLITSITSGQLIARTGRGQDLHDHWHRGAAW